MEEIPRHLQLPIPERIGLVTPVKANVTQIRALTGLMQRRVMNTQIKSLLAEQLGGGTMTSYRASEWIAYLQRLPLVVDRSGGRERNQK